MAEQRKAAATTKKAAPKKKAVVRNTAVKKTAPASKAAPVTTTEPGINPERRHRRIAEAAYFIALKKGFEKSNPQQNWLEAEHEVDVQLARDLKG